MKTIFSILFSAIFVTATAQDTLCGWQFKTGLPGDSLANIALAMNAGSYINTLGGTSSINWSTNGVTDFCAQATGWDNGMNTKAWSIRFYTTGYYHLKVSAALRAGNNNPGPRDFIMEYKTGTGNWTTIPGSNIICNNAWTGGVYQDFSLPTALDDLGDLVEIRWLMASDTALNGSLVQTIGVCKIDNIFVTGDITSGISEAGNQSSSVFPNPNNGHFTISCPTESQWQLLNPTGQRVKEGFITENRNVDINEYPSGVYLLRIVNRGKVEVVKIVKE